MSIKVKHDGNATATAFASAAGGQGKRAQQDAASMSSVMQSAANAANQQLRGASAPGATPGRSSAQLIHATAPTGGSAGVSGTRGGGAGVGASRPVSTSSTGDDNKFLGGSRVDGKPSADAFWSDNRQGWVRPWRPGEKEAEALDRKLAVQEDYALSAEGRKQMDALNSDIAKSIMSGRFSEDEIQQLQGETDVAKKRIMYADLYRAKEPTAAESFAKGTYTDENGVVFSRDGAKMIYDPNAAKIKRQEAEDTRYQNAILKLGQGYTVSEQIEDGEDETGKMTYKTVNVRKQYTPEEQDAMLKRMFPSRYPDVPAPSPASGEGGEIAAPSVSLDPNYQVDRSRLNPYAPTPGEGIVPAAPTQSQPSAMPKEKKWATYKD